MHTSPTFDRRRFLQAGGAAALGLAGRPRLLDAQEKKGDPFGGFTLGVQSYTFREFDLEPCLKRIKDLGLRYVEFYQGSKQHPHAPLDSTPEQIKAILKLCKDYDVTPLTYGVQRFSSNHDENKKTFEFGKALGIKTFSADPDLNSFDSLDKLCDEFQIAIGIHPHGPSGKMLHRWYSAEIIMGIVKNHHKLIGACLDTGHLIRVAQMGKKLDPAEEIRVMKDRNFGIHLKDHDNAKHTDVLFGKGELDVPAVLKALREVKFDRLISIEYEANPKEPTADVKELVAIFKDSVKKVT
jgi:sugar phosphate isomerase/epimerase